MGQPWELECINFNLRTLINNTNCNTEFLTYFTGIFSPEDLEHIKIEATKSVISKKFYDYVQTRTGFYKILVKGLHDTNQTKALEVLLKGYLDNGVLTPFQKCGIKLSLSPGIETSQLFLFAKDEAMNTPVYFQGHKLTINQFCQGMNQERRNEVLLDLDENAIGKIINGNPTYILAKNPLSQELPRFYQKRTLTHVRNSLNKLAFLETNNGKNIFVFVGIEKHHLSSVVRPFVTVESSMFRAQSAVQHILLERCTDFNVICKNVKKNIFLISFHEDNFYLDYSIGDLECINRYVQRSMRDVSEDELIGLLQETSFQISVCITSQSGMGNTELLKSLALQLTWENNTLVALFDIKEILEYFVNSNSVCNFENFVGMIVQKLSTNDFSRKFVRRKLLCKQTKLYILIDNLHTLDTSKLRTVESIVLYFRSFTRVNIRVVVAAPLHFIALFDSISAHSSFVTQPFSFEEQQLFLTSFFKDNAFSDTDASTCAKKLSKLLDYQLSLSRKKYRITEFPLYSRILGEISMNCLTPNGNSYRAIRYCNDIPFVFLKKVMETKFDLNSIDNLKISLNKIFACSCFDVSIGDAITSLAINSLFPANLITKVESILCREQNKQILQKSGLFRLEDGFNFIDETIAEFLVAQFLYESLHNPLKIKSALHFIFKSVFTIESTKQKLYTNNTHEYPIIGHKFKHSGVVYFLNYFLEENRFNQNKKLPIQNANIILKRADFYDMLSASISSEFRSIYDLCLNLYLPYAEATDCITSLHEFDPIRIAAKYVSRDSFKYFWESLCDTKQLGFKYKYKYRNDGYLSPIHICVHYGNYGTFEFLRKFYEKDSIASMHLLHECIIGSVTNTNEETLREKVQIIKLLITDNIDLIKTDIIGEKKRTVLLEPHTHIILLKCLIDEGADVNQLTYSDNSVLHQALVSENFAETLSLSDFKTLFKLVKDKQFKHFDAPNSLGHTPLHLLIQRMEIDAEIMQMFRDVDTNLNRKNRRGENILALAIRYGRSKETLETLLNFNIDVKSTDREGRTLLHMFFSANNCFNMDSFEFILNLKEVDINQQSRNGSTAMHLAAKLTSKNAEVVQKRLIESGANLLIKNDDGYTPIVEGFRMGENLTISLNVLESIYRSQYPLDALEAGNCLKVIILNPNFSINCIRSDAFLKTFIHFIIIVRRIKYELNSFKRNFLHEFLKYFQTKYQTFDEVDTDKNIPKFDQIHFDNGGNFPSTSIPELEVYKYCQYLLEKPSKFLFLSFRQEIQASCNSFATFLTIPQQLSQILEIRTLESRILDQDTESFVFVTSNTRLLINRLRNCFGKSLAVYPTFEYFTLLVETKDPKLETLVVNVGANSQLLHRHSDFMSRARKIIYVITTKNNTSETLGIPFYYDRIKWSDLTSNHKNILMKKNPKFPTVMKFSEQNYESLSSSHLVDLITKNDVTLEVFCKLFENKVFGTDETSFELTLSKHRTVDVSKAEGALFAIFPDLAENEKFGCHLDTPNYLYKKSFNFCDNDNQVAGSSTSTFPTKFHAFSYVGQALALDIFGADREKQKLYHRFFRMHNHNIFIRKFDNCLSNDSSTVSDVNIGSECVICFEFTHPVLVFFYDKYFETPSAFLQEVGDLFKQYISACIRASLCKLLKALFEEKEGWFLEEDFVFIAIACANISTIILIVDCYEKSSKKKIASLTLGGNKDITPLHVAIQRGNYHVVDYILHTTSFEEHNGSGIIRYCLSCTCTLKPTELESRKAIVELLLSKLYANVKDILKNVLVEVTNIHVDLIKFLVSCGAELWDVDKRTGSNIAHLAPKYLRPGEYLELVEYIVNSGQGQLFKSRNFSEESALRCALRCMSQRSLSIADETHICKTLEILNKEAGVKFDLPNKFHKTILKCAMDKKLSQRIIQTIIALGGK